MDTLLVVLGILALVLLIIGGVAWCWLRWSMRSPFGEQVRVKAEEHLAIWQIERIGREAAERLRQAYSRDRP